MPFAFCFMLFTGGAYSWAHECEMDPCPAHGCICFYRMVPDPMITLRRAAVRARQQIRCHILPAVRYS